MKKNLRFNLGNIIFVAEYAYVSIRTSSGLTGFDSGLEWYVSTRSVVCWLLNLSGHKFIWRKQVRSRCLIEA